MNPQPPKDGQVGEFLLIHNHVPQGTDVLAGDWYSLWLCLGMTHISLGGSAEWVQIPFKD
jgi:hypothetical protein